MTPDAHAKVVELLDLPIELRLQIYRYTIPTLNRTGLILSQPFVRPKNYKLSSALLPTKPPCRFDFESTDDVAFESSSYQHLNLLCRKTHQEMPLVFPRKLNFRIEVSGPLVLPEGIHDSARLPPLPWDQCKELVINFDDLGAFNLCRYTRQCLDQLMMGVPENVPLGKAPRLILQMSDSTVPRERFFVPPCLDCYRSPWGLSCCLIDIITLEARLAASGSDHLSLRKGLGYFEDYTDCAAGPLVLDHPALQTLSKHTSLAHWYMSLSEIISILSKEAKEVDFPVSCCLQTLVYAVDHECRMRAFAAKRRRDRPKQEELKRALVAKSRLDRFIRGPTEFFLNKFAPLSFRVRPLSSSAQGPRIRHTAVHRSSSALRDDSTALSEGGSGLLLFSQRTLTCVYLFVCSYDAAQGCQYWQRLGLVSQ